MKSIRLIGCVLMTLMGSGQLMADATLTQSEQQGSRVISLLDLSEEVFQDFLQGKMSDYTLKCPEGTCLPIPLKMTLKGQFLALEPEATPSFYLKVIKTCYIRCEKQENLLFSTDQKEWKGFSEFITEEQKVEGYFINFD